jgi:endoribonuclease Dicer
LFVTQPTQHEGILHIARQKIISNKALLVNADKSGLPQYIQSKPFMPKMWIPKGYSILKLQPKSSKVNEDSILKDTDAKPASNGMASSRPGTPTINAVDMVDSPREEADPNGNKSTPKKTLYDEDHLWLGDKVRQHGSDYRFHTKEV